MRIEKMKENTFKISFNLQDLNRNNIDLHSFLANSKNSQIFLKAIIEIAKEDFFINITDFNMDLISFNNKNFTILLSPNSKNNSDSSLYNFKNIPTEQKVYKFLLYKFDSYEELYSFCIYLKRTISTQTYSVLYTYNHCYYLYLDSANNYLFQAILSEFKDNMKISDTSFYKLKKASDTLILENAIENII